MFPSRSPHQTSTLALRRKGRHRGGIGRALFRFAVLNPTLITRIAALIALGQVAAPRIPRSPTIVISPWGGPGQPPAGLRDFSPCRYGHSHPERGGLTQDGRRIQGARAVSSVTDVQHLLVGRENRGAYECVAAFSATDFRPDLAKVDVPMLVIHGDDDQIGPFEVGRKRSAEMVAGAVLKRLLRRRPRPTGYRTRSPAHGPARLHQLLTERTMP